jgi:hypothetical protein
MSDWLELDLAHQLAPVKAPDELWQRVEGAIQTAPAGPGNRSKWLPIAAILMVMAGASAMWMFAKAPEPFLDLQHLAALDLDNQERLDLRSSNPGEIAEWARREAGVELAIAPSPSTRLIGGRILRQRDCKIASIAYQVNGQSARLLVAHVSHTPTGAHGGPTWQAAGQSYALVMAPGGRAEGACRICHNDL